MKSVRSTSSRLIAAGVALAMFGGSGAFAAGEDTAPPGRRIAYAFTDIIWSIYESKDAKEECPEGVQALGPREQFKQQFPDDGTKRKFVDTQLAREAEIWWPNTNPDRFAYREAGGKHAIGLNLDGKVGANDFTSPDGTPGVDNGLFRVIGCIMNYRTGGSVLNFDQTFFKKYPFDRIMIELTDVDSLVNDDDVTITTYRGLDPLLNDATGNYFAPGGTQRLDLRFGKDFIHSAKGKIVNGVLITQPMDINMPRESAIQEMSYEWMRDARFQVKLLPDRAEGIIGGYADIETWYNARNRQWGTHHQAYGQQSMQSIYKVLRKWADGFPNAKGENTAISSAYSVKLIQVRVLRPDKKVADGGVPTQLSDSSAAK